MYTGTMLISRFDDLRRKKSYKEGRDLPLRTISAESGLALTTLNKVKKGEVANLHVSTLDALCRYFGVKSIAELIEYKPDEEEPS